MAASKDEAIVAERFVTLYAYSHAMCEICTLHRRTSL